ncbi:MAG: 4-hydroxythreonine-4-phosphate dehydrogenase PdxA [Verrucomicrobia bacterium]|nr:4-hydroxythreonine-4-phosphate dehydrogenase PdxA [Verrucomicrobiota bacterium]
MPLPRILITSGDPAGIGPEVIAAALASSDLPDHCIYEWLPVPSSSIPGKPDERSARIAWDALEESARRLNEGSADAVVTGPVSKEQLQAIGFPYPGQTEFFTDRLNAGETAMCLSGNHLTVGLVTIHIPLADVARTLSIANIVAKGKLLAEFVQRRKGRLPRIAVCGLNPHAGENGAFRSEELEIIAPAITALNQSGIAQFSGPHVPDAIFRDAVSGKYDAVLCMYHDQGLIPLKLLDFDNAVNITLGLPKPRLSPDHGTAFAIAGKNIAHHASMLRALQLAAEMVK